MSKPRRAIRSRSLFFIDVIFPMNQRHQFNEESNHNWSTFAACFIGLFPYIPHDEVPQGCACALGATLKETSNNYKQAEAPFLSEIEEWIRTFCKVGSAPAPSKSIAYFLGLRCAVLECIFLKFSIGIGSNFTQSTIIPFPSLPVLQIVEWFLLDWWRNQGALEVAKFLHLEDLYSKED
jgi:hypothetical protein